jgi:hypothetical protein
MVLHPVVNVRARLFLLFLPFTTSDLARKVRKFTIARVAYFSVECFAQTRSHSP